MAEANAMAEAMDLLEAEPSKEATCPGPDIPAIREQLVVLVSTGKSKEAIGVHLTQDQVKRLESKDVEKFYKRHETYVGAKTTETFVDSFISFYTYTVNAFLPVKDLKALQRDLKKDYVITKELSTFVGGLALKCGRMFTVANTILITARHIDFSAFSAAPGRDTDGFPLCGIDEVPAKQPSATAEQLPSTAE